MRVPRTFGFVDLSGFTNFTAEFGDDAAADVLASYRSVTRRVASDRGVRIAKWLGDGCMIVAVDEGDGIATVLPEGVVAGAPREISLHGFPEPVRVTNLTGTPVVQARHGTGELWTRSPFVA